MKAAGSQNNAVGHGNFAVKTEPGCFY